MNKKLCQSLSIFFLSLVSNLRGCLYESSFFAWPAKTRRPEFEVKGLT